MTVAVHPLPAPSIADGRSDRLARGLVSLGFGPGDRVVVLCCDEHLPDRAVGYRAAQQANLDAIVLPLDLPIDSLRLRLTSAGPQLILACDEGVTAWRQTGVACRVVGDAPGVLWWKMLEARHAAARCTAEAAVGEPPH